MKRLLFLAVFLFTIVSSGKSQELSKRFSVIGSPEMDLEFYEKDPEADAVVLFNVGHSVFLDGNYNIEFSEIKRIKIFKASAMHYAEISIPYYVDGYGKTEIVRSIEAYTYNEENGVITTKELSKKAIYEETINDRWKVMKFAFPDVKEGSVIEYKYVLETPFRSKMPDWTFQDEIPTIYSEYKVNMIPFYEYVFIAQGIKKFDYQNSEVGRVERKYGNVSEAYGQTMGNGFKFKDVIHTYVMKDVPAFKDEGFITSKTDYIMKLDFQLAKFHRPTGGSEEIISTWPKLTEELLDNDNFGKYVKKAQKQAKDILEELNLAGKTDKQKAKILVDYVRQHINWNKTFTEYAYHSPKELLEKRSGTSGEINLFIIGLLRQAGITASPVILSTRSHGKIAADYPFDHFFNYTAVLVEAYDNMFLADGTQSFVSYDKLPIWCLNEKGLVIREDKPFWVSLENNAPSFLSAQFTIIPNIEKLSSECSVNIQSTEYESFNYKFSYDDDASKLKDAFLDKGFKNVDEVSTMNYDRNDVPYIMVIKGNSEVGVIASKIVVKPFLEMPIQKNRLQQKTRTYPVDMEYAKVIKYSSSIQIPDGYQPVSLPEGYNVADDLALVNITYKQEGNQVLSEASYSFKKAVYESHEYPRIKFYYDQIVKTFNQAIAFEKVN